MSTMEPSPAIRMLIAALAFVPALLLRAWAVSKMWLWFVVPLGLPPIGYAHALGISLFVGWLTYQTPSTDQDDGFWLRSLLTSFIAPPVLVLFGWLYVQFMPGAAP